MDLDGCAEGLDPSHCATITVKTDVKHAWARAGASAVREPIPEEFRLSTFKRSREPDGQVYHSQASQSAGKDILAAREIHGVLYSVPKPWVRQRQWHLQLYCLLLINAAPFAS